MRRSSKTILATLLCGSMIASAASCASGPTYPLTIDGEKIRAGLYIIEQNNAVENAKAKVREEQPDLDTYADGFDFLKQKVEGKSFSEWVDERTVEICRNYVAINRLFDQYGLEISKEETDYISQYVKSLWTEENQYAIYIYGVNVVGEYYEKLGVGQESFTDFQIASEKRELLFDHFYGENGEKAATADEINAKLNEDYMALNYFRYDLENGEGAQAYADRITNGDSFELVYRDHYEAAAQEADAKKAAEAAAEAAESGAETEAPAETEAAEGDTSEDQQMAVPETDSLLKIVKKDETAPSEEFVKQAAEMSNGEVRVITFTEGDTTYNYVVQKLDVTAKTDMTTNERDTIRRELKSDEFQQMIDDAGKDYSVYVDSSKDMYKIKTILDSRAGI